VVEVVKVVNVFSGPNTKPGAYVRLLSPKLLVFTKVVYVYTFLELHACVYYFGEDPLNCAFQISQNYGDLRQILNYMLQKRNLYI